MTNIPKEVLIRQWFHTAVSEKEGQALVGHIAGTKKYGLLVPYTDLPEEAKIIVRREYEERNDQIIVNLDASDL